MSAALIIIDLIEDLIGPKGRANHCREQVMANNLIGNVNAAAAYARVRKIPVIWVRVGFADDYHDIPPHSPLFNHLKQTGALRLSSPGCRWVPELQREAEDLQFEKTAVSAFSGNNLLDWLRRHRCHHLLLGGVSTPLAIESTARQAHDAGFHVTVLQDLCAAPTQEIHQQSLDTLQNLAEISRSLAWMRS
ncbi:Isochorismatase family protein yecD [Serratia entomophila]|uniref:cysteine hydrolase family protein n=1 Tax=Serratia entomophila TaxID=42906 RepID=UPI002177D7F3|nr:isochorismatase family cysteine hydrolase [Serratia entomophila]CAI0909312.1 Isochorismatase family protein yecD [Serratia entomophila]CAI1694407.1 Isochorismatase family protein yecD [Serratia entomophila]CAI1714489.1 Isochorismatase family protein yecD [Serratia entomophila]CAI1751579.1 Isochorismatase family protein yecD [Serratia entomophila]CAI2051004.1 Isochorismatase family protein yecD [Serratia entomophila]